MAKKNGVVDLSTFTINKEEPLSIRCADFLDWLSKKNPGIFVTPNVAVKAIMGYRHTPRIRSDEVDKLRARYGGVRKALRTKYGKDLIVEAGGIRASTDDADVLVNSVPKYVRKLDSARTAVVQVDALVDMKLVPNTPALAPYREMHDKQIKPLVKQLMSPAFEKMLQLPAGNKNDDKP